MDEHIEAVQRMQDYIETNLDKNITTADLANASRYSRGTHTGFLWSFCT